MNILALDPGKDKIGLAIIDPRKTLREKKIISPQDLTGEIIKKMSKYSLSVIVVGNRTRSYEIKKKIEALKLNIKIEMVEEHLSSWEARKRYWEENPPEGLWKLIPTTLRTPSQPYDDFAAVILAERYLKTKSTPKTTIHK